MSDHPALAPFAIFAAIVAAPTESLAQCEYAWQAGYAYTNIETTIYSAEVIDHGGGPRLYVAGNINIITGIAANDIAYWSDETWHTVPGPTAGPFTGGNPVVFDLLEWDDSSGPALFAGGDWDMIGAAISGSIARWDGSAWTGLGSGVNVDGFYTGTVRALAVFKDLNATGWIEETRAALATAR